MYWEAEYYQCCQSNSPMKTCLLFLPLPPPAVKSGRSYNCTEPHSTQTRQQEVGRFCTTAVAFKLFLFTCS